ncbi:hypothetical protein HPC49_49145 [Pyxidicoccus fallax]|uniref:Lipoprotein n=1 Tax=Pyxidicoccus fallax TaxID=394095 RepID=A0A848LPH5_9BACT|nr:putative metal-binding motif-containing protein [Pyxidicoccus fallax]NMO19560.1 hypothetical protein [Pyxidicoccus fallax]NPC86141.1 hypothetical protein [Pyxidicoccus fallax]
MNRLLTWGAVLSLGFAGCTVPSLEELENERFITVLVEYTPSFKKGCIAVNVFDAATPTNVLDESVVTNLRTQVSPLTVTILRKEQWGEKLRLVVTAHEQTCEGPKVDEERLNLDLSGTGQKPEQRVTLVTPDEDGDGYVPTANGGTDCDDSAQTGAQTYPGAPELCDSRDNNCVGGVADEVDSHWYPDGDGDGYGRNENPTVQCESPGPNFVKVTNGQFDCNDSVKEVHPGAQELCNNRDDNCTGGEDEPFIGGDRGKGAQCNADICTGTYVCNAAGSATECSATPPVDYYPDVDWDGQGNKSASAARICAPTQPPANHVRDNHADCDDADPVTKDGADEVCDAVDNNCNELVDDGADCGGTLQRVVGQAALGGDSHDWRTVAVDPLDGYPVWVAGMEGVLAVRTRPDVAFKEVGPTSANNCGTTDWYAAWVRPDTDTVFLAGEGGRLAEHDGIRCILTATATNIGSGHYFTGLVGFSTPSLKLYAVTTDGQLYEWVPGASLTRVRDSFDAYWDVHAWDASRLLVVGDNRSNPAPPLLPRLHSFTPPYTSAPMSHPLDTPAGYTGRLRGVVMASSSLAYAVGDNGLALRWDGTNWARTVPPAGAETATFTSVTRPIAGSSAAFVVERGAPAVANPATPLVPGKLRRLTSFGWAASPSFIGPGGVDANPDRPLYDVAVTTTVAPVLGVWNIWLVGDDGRVYHYPE